MSDTIVISSACRTPLGMAPLGNLSDVSAVDLLTAVFKETLKRSKLDPRHISEVIAGNVAQSSDAPNIARVAALKAGVPKQVPGFTVQRNCGSGLQALVSAAQAVKAYDADMVLVGGTESMSNIPHILRGLRKGLKYDPRKMLANFVDGLGEGLIDPITGEVMGKTAENIAATYAVSRADQDEFAADSHRKAFRAMREGKFRPQIVAIQTRKELVAQDEGINAGLNKETLALFPTIFQEKGTVTPGNSCPLSDGASSFLVTTLAIAKRYSLNPEAEILSYAFAGCDPSYMGMGPVWAIPNALLESRISVRDIDLFEINEAFAAQVLACQRGLQIPIEKLNVWGGAIALGHPVGATGAILTTKAIAMLKDLKKELAVISMCIGGGQGGALVLRNLN